MLLTDFIGEVQKLMDENEQLRQELEHVPLLLRGRGQPKGPNRPNARKLTKNEVSDIRSLHRGGIRQVQLADMFDVNPATISRIVRGQYHRAVA